MRKLFSIVILMTLISGCSTEKEQEIYDLESSMVEVFHYELDVVEPGHADEVNQWLENARLTGESGQYFIYQDNTREDLYAYVYGKGYSDYEVAFIYNPKDPVTKGQIHVTGIMGDSKADHFVQIRTINDLSIMFTLSDESLQEKLK
ncbi:hypothetical protein DUZ99_19625 [Xylanibacillus composti]|uniref:Lipoprotein n=1 Tax=Xylanibacillus composti TaxID=1572762 RepID=A0A8J4H6B6_9BACL|nr:hypothetical protein [Xylanibacillus composti]MDT9727176.1 hypothetical protein [Xylanibacillus composti]GIQ70411.1 hypothetical protein XYCOK13_32350 [Xylanibacillus composti]